MEPSGLVVFGAGNIGRGLLGELAAREGRKLTFVEALPSYAERLRRAGSYRVSLSGGEECTTTVEGFGVLDAEDREGIRRALSAAAFAAVAVGPANLDSLASLLAPILSSLEKNPRSGKTLPILVCENLKGAAAVFSRALTARGVPEGIFSCVSSSVERMVRSDPDSLTLYGEGGQSLLVDLPAWTSGTGAALPRGYIGVADVEPYYARKLYTNNAGHAAVAYTGHLRGYRTIAEAMADPEIGAVTEKLLEAACRMLELDYGLDPVGLERHRRELTTLRYTNAALADPIARVARDPLRKLAPGERLIGLLRRLEARGLAADSVYPVVAAALGYRSEQDPESLELARRLAEGGPEGVLRTVCSIEPKERHSAAILHYFHKETP
jgi:mannitol-1-phosphate 5-dehydrogenase